MAMNHHGQDMLDAERPADQDGVPAASSGQSSDNGSFEHLLFLS